MNLVVLFCLPGNGSACVYYESLGPDGSPGGNPVAVPGVTLPIDVIVFASRTPFGLVTLKHLGVTYDGDTTTIAALRRMDLFTTTVRESYQLHNIASLTQ